MSTTSRTVGSRFLSVLFFGGWMICQWIGCANKPQQISRSSSSLNDNFQGFVSSPSRLVCICYVDTCTTPATNRNQFLRIALVSAFCVQVDLKDRKKISIWRFFPHLSRQFNEKNTQIELPGTFSVCLSDDQKHRSWRDREEFLKKFTRSLGRPYLSSRRSNSIRSFDDEFDWPIDSTNPSFFFSWPVKKRRLLFFFFALLFILT